MKASAQKKALLEYEARRYRDATRVSRAAIANGRILLAK
jgi:hypothetical protein